MAVLVNQNQNDNQTPPSQQQGPINVGSSGSGVTGVSGASGVKSNAPMPNQPPQQSSGFVNLQSYLKANQGAGQNMANKIGSNIGQQSSSIQQQEQNLGQGIQGQLKSEQDRIANASGLASQINQDPSKALSNLQNLYGTNANVNTIANTSQGNVGNINTTAQNQLANLSTGVNNVQQASNLAGSESGRSELLRQSFGRPTYTSGQNTLDQLLLQGSGQGLTNLQKTASQQAQATQAGFNNVQANLKSQIDAINGQATSAQNALQKALGTYANPANNVVGKGALGTLQNQLNDQLSTAQTQQTTNYNKILSDFQSGKISVDEAKQLGLDPTQKYNTYGLNLSDLANNITQGGPITADQTMTADQYARYQALNQLAGTTNPLALDQTQVGKGPQYTNFNSTDFNQQIAQAQSDAQAKLAAQQMPVNIQNVSNLLQALGGTDPNVIGVNPGTVSGAAYRSLFDQSEPSMAGGAQGIVNQILARYQANPNVNPGGGPFQSPDVLNAYNTLLGKFAGMKQPEQLSLVNKAFANQLALINPEKQALGFNNQLQIGDQPTPVPGYNK